MNRIERINISLWVLYDFANSFIYIAFLLYFSQWAVVDRHISDFNFNLCFVFSSLALIITAPYIGSMLDKKWKNISGLRFTTSAMVAFYTLAALSALKNFDTPALVSFAIGQYFFALSFTFYTPLLAVLSKPENQSRISGLGAAGNYFGNISAVLLTLLLIKSNINLFGGTDRSEVLLPAIFVFFLFSLPMLLFFKESPRLPSQKQPQNYWLESKKIFSNQDVILFLIAFFLFNGAILTIINNYPIIFENLWHLSDKAKSLILLATVTASVFGGLSSGYISDRFGGKSALIGIVSSWAVLLTALSLTFIFSWFTAATLIIGFLFGAAWAISRVIMLWLAPLGQRNLTFAYYNIAERASLFFAPVIWGLIVSKLTGFEQNRYRFGLVAMAVFIGLSLPLMAKIKIHGKC